MKIFYHEKYNIELGVLNFLHPFDGKKFKHIYESIKDEHVMFGMPASPADDSLILPTINELMARLIKQKRYILRALELPYIPFISYGVIDKKILEPMRWGVSGTLAATYAALEGQICWNLSGGYHHASPHSAEGFCIYNDIAIAYKQILVEKKINIDDRILIVDVDAHHGNGNAYYFMDNEHVTILDAYNDEIYPKQRSSKKRININLPFSAGTNGEKYLAKLEEALSSLEDKYTIAYVIAGTDVLSGDPLGGFDLSVDDCVLRDKIIIEKLRSLSIPSVVVGGGGYSKLSSVAVSKSITTLARLGF